MNIKEFFKYSFKGFFHLFGTEISAYTIYKSDDLLIKKILDEFKIKTIIDVGANNGGYAGMMWRIGFRGEIYSFEPISEPYTALTRNAQGNSSWHTYHLGMGSQQAETEINVSENIFSSSLLKVNDQSLKAEPSTKIARKETIRIETIDSFFADKTLKGDVLLKLDVQGYEMEALRGATKLLSSFKFLQIELSFVTLYEGGPLFNEIVSFLAAKGFEIFTIIPGFRDPQTGRMLQADGIFIRSN